MTELQRKLGPTRNQWILLVFLVGALIGLGIMARTGGGPPDNIDWRYQFDAAKAEAQASGKPMLLYFTADWCGPCQRMKRQVWPDERLAQTINSRVIPIYLDVDKPQVKDLAGRYHLTSFPIPLFIMTNPQGRPLVADQTPLTLDGYATVKQLITLIDASAEARPLSPADREAG